MGFCVRLFDDSTSIVEGQKTSGRVKPSRDQPLTLTSKCSKLLGVTQRSCYWCGARRCYIEESQENERVEAQPICIQTATRKQVWKLHGCRMSHRL
jgi:hypothetical protein